MPDDSIVFASSREPKYVHCNRHLMCNLYKMEHDGANIYQISKNTLFDFHCSLMAGSKVYAAEYFTGTIGIVDIDPAEYVLSIGTE